MIHKDKRTSSQAGFSILEALLGAVILAVCSVIAANNYSQNASLRSHDLSQSMMGRELDPLMRTYFANHLIPKIRDQICKLKQEDLKYPLPGTQPLQIRPWSNPPAKIASAIPEDCRPITATANLNSTMIKGCIKISNLKSLSKLQSTGNNRNNFAYVQFEATFKDMLNKLGSTSSTPACKNFRGLGSPMVMEVFYTAYWIERVSSTHNNMVKYSNTLNLNNR